MLHTRASGVLMALSSLPSRYGIGVMGEETKRFILKIKEMGFSYWQVLPLNPPDSYGSPYASQAAFAVSHMYINPDALFKMGLISEETLGRNIYYGSPYTADYEFARTARTELLKEAFSNISSDLRKEIRVFCEENRWCEGYALYAAAKERFGDKPWYEWDEKFARFESARTHAGELQETAAYYRFEQYIAYTQWREIKQFANDHGVKILGDMPIYVSFDSADVWSNRHLFEIDDRTFIRKRVSGVPPDYFSEDGQLWGNPFTTGSLWKRTTTDGGATVSARHGSCMTQCASTISARLPRTGQCLPTAKPRKTALGKRPRQKAVRRSIRCLRRSADCGRRPRYVRGGRHTAFGRYGVPRYARDSVRL